VVPFAVYNRTALSGSISPLARGPLLDGLAPVNYRWVAPPPELESTNQQPTSGTFSLQLGPDGVKSKVVFTSDNQVTVIVAEGSIATAPGQRSVDLSVVPLDPVTLPPPGNDLTVFGNARFMAFLVIFSGFWAMFWHIFYALPFYVRDYLKVESFELFETVDAWTIILVTVPVTALAKKLPPLTAMTLGFALATACWFLMALAPTVKYAIVSSGSHGCLSRIGVAMNRTTTLTRLTALPRS